MKERITRLEAIAKELHEIANSFAGDETGIAAAALHGAGGRVLDATRMLTTGITYEDKLRVATEWCDQRPHLSEAARAFTIEQLTK